MGQPAAERDHLLIEDIKDLLAHDSRLQGLALTVDVRGGVAHISGQARSDEDRWLLRRLIGRLRGIHAVWDVLRLPGEAQPRVLDIGCGGVKQHDWAIGLDRYPTPAVHVVTDLEGSLPVADNTADQVYAIHVLEHIHNMVQLMNEIHRVLKPSGVLHLMTPDWRAISAVADPTHVRFIAAQTFKAFCRPTPGICTYWPLAVSTDHDTVYADLRPVKDGLPRPSERILARFFD